MSQTTLPHSPFGSPERAELGAASAPSRFALHRGQRIHYTARGSGPLVILQHGALSDGTGWAMSGFVAALTDRFCVACVDSLAHGQSDKPADPGVYDLKQRAGDLVAVMDDLGAARAHIVGYSMGGWMASGVALHYPERLASLTIAGWDIEHGTQTAAAAMGVEAITSDWLIAIARALAPEMVAWVTPEIEPALRAAIEAVNQLEGTADAVAHLRVPVLFWMGRDDAYHDPMQAFAQQHGQRFLSTPGDHLAAFVLYGAEAARGVRAFLLDAPAA